MTRRVAFAAALLVALFMSGCACNKYDAFLRQVRENLAEDIRPKYEKALRDSGRPEDLMKNDLGLVDDTVSSIDRVLAAGPEAADDE
jgi:hypothetical protein